LFCIAVGMSLTISKPNFKKYFGITHAKYSGCFAEEIIACTNNRPVPFPRLEATIPKVQNSSHPS
jgi:hypothetical protein